MEEVISLWLDTFNEMRKKSGMSLDEISAKSGVPKGTLAKITSGVTKAPPLETMRKLVYSMGYTLDDLDDTLPKKRNSPGTDESAPGEEIRQEIIHLAGKLSLEQRDLFLALLRLTAARNQGLSAADLVSAGEAALKVEHHNPTP